jgi:hypothetical protein
MGMDRSQIAWASLAKCRADLDGNAERVATACQRVFPAREMVAAVRPALVLVCVLNARVGGRVVPSWTASGVDPIVWAFKVATQKARTVGPLRSGVRSSPLGSARSDGDRSAVRSSLSCALRSRTRSERAARYRLARRLSGKACGRRRPRRALDLSGGRLGDALASQAVTALRRWLWSLRRLWVAAMGRHSDRQAARPRRWKRLIWRLNFRWPKTGSMVACRVR